MNAVKNDQSTTIHERTPQILHRRRSLFPTESSDSESDSDLGHMSPISFDSCFGPEDLKACILKQRNSNKQLGLTTDTIGDYDILGVVDIEKYGACTPTNDKLPASETMSPLYLSPHMSRIKEDSDNVVNETPSKISPSCKLKTPHDTSNTNTKLPKLVRKSLLDSSELPSNKRKLSPYNSPKQTKHIKLDPKNSKVRTTLFPEVNVSLSTKQFYPETEDVMEKILNKKETRSKSSIHFNTSRKTKPRKRMGQINAGVGHKIRKPKQKKASKTTLVKAALNSIGNTSLTDYIMDLKEMRSKIRTAPLIENKENAKPLVQENPIIPPTAECHQEVVLSTAEVQQNLILPATITKTSSAEAESKKRPVTSEAEPDTNKKFFKFSRSKGVVKMNKHIKLEVDQGKVTVLEKPKMRESKDDFDMSDLVSDEPDMPKADIESVITSLEDEGSCAQEISNKITLQAHNSVVASDNSILLHQPPRCPASVILSPISQMCDDTSGLALSSPKMAKNLTSVLNGMPNATENVFNRSIPQKNNGFFPIFFGNNTIPEKRLSKGTTCTNKKFRKLSSTQMFLDAGQKRFGVTQCPECEIVYHVGDPSDEIIHLHYHNSGHILRFQGWKNERVVADFLTNGRIIQIVSTDSKSWWKKVSDLMDMVNQELGCYNMEFSLDNSQIFIYIKNKFIVGCVVAIAKDEGHQMLPTSATEVDLCSEKKYPIKCGIPRIWVAHNHRKQGIATALMDALKKNFIKGYVLKNSDIAFSPPTEMGKKFAIGYCKTPNFFIYYV